jgi:hypothetical protein
MIKVAKSAFFSRCYALGWDLSECSRAIVEDHGYSLLVDESSKSFPLKHKRPARGLGDYVAAALKTVGITPERVSRLTGRPCGCKRRQQALNQWGRRLGIGSTAGGKDARTRHADGQGRGDLPKAS